MFQHPQSKAGSPEHEELEPSGQGDEREDHEDEGAELEREPVDHGSNPKFIRSRVPNIEIVSGLVE